MEVWQVKPAHRFSEELVNLVPRSCDPFGQHRPLDKGNAGSGNEIEELVWVNTQSPGELAASQVWSKQFCTNDAFHMLAGRFRRTSYDKLLAPFLSVIILYSMFTSNILTLFSIV